MWGSSVATPGLLFELFDAVALIGVKGPEQRAASVKSEVSDGDEKGGLGIGPADIEPADDAAFLSHVEDTDDLTAVRDRTFQRALAERGSDAGRQASVQWKCGLHVCDQLLCLVRIVDQGPIPEVTSVSDRRG